VARRHIGRLILSRPDDHFSVQSASGELFNILSVRFERSQGGDAVLMQGRQSLNVGVGTNFDLVLEEFEGLFSASGFFVRQDPSSQ